MLHKNKVMLELSSIIFISQLWSGQSELILGERKESISAISCGTYSK